MNKVTEKVIIKIETLGGYLQSLISGLSKNPNEGKTVMATYEVERARQFDVNSEELNEVVHVLQENHIDYRLTSI